MNDCNAKSSSTENGQRRTPSLYSPAARQIIPHRCSKFRLDFRRNLSDSVSRRATLDGKQDSRSTAHVSQKYTTGCHISSISRCVATCTPFVMHAAFAAHRSTTQHSVAQRSTAQRNKSKVAPHPPGAMGWGWPPDFHPIHPPTRG